jgi:hypothetical protein
MATGPSRGERGGSDTGRGGGQGPPVVGNSQGEVRESQMALEKLFGRKRKVVIYTQPT